MAIELDQMPERNIHRVLAIFRAAEVSQKEAMENVYSLLDAKISLDRVKPFVVTPGPKWASESLQSLVVEVAKTVEAHRTKQHVTDWPFENFWWNPREPDHSRLIGYFIDPEESHRCGIILLRRLFAALGLTELCVDEHCKVTVEKVYRIDVLITRKRPDGGYAIIIENRSTVPRGFSDIRCVYLPLKTYGMPSDDSRGKVPRERIKVATFEREIAAWLKGAEEDERVIPEMRVQWPGPRQGFVAKLAKRTQSMSPGAILPSRKAPQHDHPKTEIAGRIFLWEA